LVLRLFCESVALLAITVMMLREEELARFGIASLIMMLPTLLLAVVSQAAFPTIARVAHDQRARVVYLRALAMRLLLIALIAAPAIVVSRRLFASALPPLHFEALGLASILCVGLFGRVAAIVAGAYLMAGGRFALALRVNVIEALVGAVLVVPAVHLGGVVGAAWFVVGLAFVSAALHAAAYTSATRARADFA
jgi:O-antigen/teichoic acid export membrane protein